MSDWVEVGIPNKVRCTLCRRVRGVTIEDVPGTGNVVYPCCTDCLEWMHKRKYDVLRMLEYAHSTMPVEDVVRNRRDRSK